MIKTLSAGQIDSGLSSISTFVASLFAVRAFDEIVLGAYVIVFTAWNVARTFPSEMVYMPSEVVAVGRPEKGRIGILGSSLTRGILLSLVGAAGVLASTWIIDDHVTAEQAVALTFTGAAVTVLAPLLDHWRRVFHIAGNSWRAAATSGVHVTVTILVILVLRDRIDSSWLPFGSLAAGFLASGVVALLLTYSLSATPEANIEQPAWPELTLIGRWLLVANLATFGSEFLLAVVTEAAAGPEVLGYGEGARVVARPVIILGMGLAAVLSPRSVRAGMGPSLEKARSARRVLWVASLVAGLLYLPVVGFNWPWNPLPGLLPNAYAVSGLVAVAIVGSIIFNLGLPWYFELLGGRRQRGIAWVDGASSAVKVGFGLLAPVLQAFTLPLAALASWSTRGIGLGLLARDMFKQGNDGAGEPIGAGGGTPGLASPERDMRG